VSTQAAKEQLRQSVVAGIFKCAQSLQELVVRRTHDRKPMLRDLQTRAEGQELSLDELWPSLSGMAVLEQPPAGNSPFLDYWIPGLSGVTTLAFYKQAPVGGVRLFL